MATRSFTVEMPVHANGSNSPGAMIVTWTGLLTGDDGAPFVMPFKQNKSVQVFGAFSGASIVIEGTNQQAYTTVPAVIAGRTYAQLNDPHANALDFTLAKIEQVLENPNAIRPRVVGGDGNTTLTVVMVISSAQYGF